MENPSRTSGLIAVLGKLCVAATVFAAILGGWAYGKPLIINRLPLPDSLSRTAAGRCDVWVIGSSTVQRWQSLPHDLPGWQPHNRGIDGALLEQIDARLGVTDVAAPPAAIIVYAGENDINAGATGERAALDALHLVVDATAQMPRTPVFIVGLKPSPNRWSQRPEQLRYNRIVASFAHRRGGLTFVPAGTSLLRNGLPDPSLYADGVHMNDRGYARWSQEVRRGFEAGMTATGRRTCGA